jgi:hypothetical protein
VGLFRKIKVGFELVGHTHEDVDQMFSGMIYSSYIIFIMKYQHLLYVSQFLLILFVLLNGLEL